eukprot:15476128-Alexandrium_andersonii.AAC.1
MRERSAAITDLRKQRSLTAAEDAHYGGARDRMHCSMRKWHGVNSACLSLSTEWHEEDPRNDDKT